VTGMHQRRMVARVESNNDTRAAIRDSQKRTPAGAGSCSLEASVRFDVDASQHLSPIRSLWCRGSYVDKQAAGLVDHFKVLAILQQRRVQLHRLVEALKS